MLLDISLLLAHALCASAALTWTRRQEVARPVEPATGALPVRLCCETDQSVHSHRFDGRAKMYGRSYGEHDELHRIAFNRSQPNAHGRLARSV